MVRIQYFALWAKLFTTRFNLGCSYIGLLHWLCKPDRGVQLPYGQLSIFCEFLTQHRGVMPERENKQSSSYVSRKEESVMTLTDKRKILWGCGTVVNCTGFAYRRIVGSNPTSSTYFIKLFTNFLIKHFG